MNAYVNTSDLLRLCGRTENGDIESLGFQRQILDSFVEVTDILHYDYIVEAAVINLSSVFHSHYFHSNSWYKGILYKPCIKKL